MRPCAWARRERKSDPQKLRIDRNDERVCVRIVPQSRLYAECFGWVVLCPKHPGYTTDPGAGMSGLQVDSTKPGTSSQMPVPTEKPPRCCDEASFSAKLGCPWSI